VTWRMTPKTNERTRMKVTGVLCLYGSAYRADGQHKNNQKRVHRVGLSIMIGRECATGAPGAAVSRDGMDVGAV
jgi:hypothetical protein